MGYDITYHPIKESEIQKWYFDALQDEQGLEENSMIKNAVYKRINWEEK
ncbi:MAG: hypothetical protein KGV59_02185 [Tenacibaculum sp.]|nr:hypothetical protein [Tenacibaculum sp.]